MVQSLRWKIWYNKCDNHFKWYFFDAVVYLKWVWVDTTARRFFALHWRCSSFVLFVFLFPYVLGSIPIAFVSVPYQWFKICLCSIFKLFFWMPKCWCSTRNFATTRHTPKKCKQQCPNIFSCVGDCSNYMLLVSKK